MNKLIFLMMLPFCALGQSKLSQGVSNSLEKSGPLRVAISLTPFDIHGLHRELVFGNVPLDYRKKLVPQALQAHAESTQIAFLQKIRAIRPGFNGVKKQLWVINMVVLEADKVLIHQLANFPEVTRIALDGEDYIKPLDPPRQGDTAQPRSVGGHEPGHNAINAPALWAMGYTGRNRMALLVDTGVWPNEPALDGRYLGDYRPLAETWYPYDSPTPKDKSNSHGTHCIGTVLGLDANNADTIGVAFNAKFIATDPVVQNLADVKPLSEFAEGFQWVMNPDGDINTVSDVPDVVTNSWGHGTLFAGDECVGPFAEALTAVHAMGIASVQSAGNDGPGVSTIGVPSTMNFDLVNVFSVGAIQGAVSGYPIASFSSRGPSICPAEGSLAIKPEVVAPGYNVRSCVRGGYDNYNGTSMAAPHVTGAVLLLKEAFPEVAGEEILFALYTTATDLGDPGEDNTYGMGLIDALAAFNYLAQFHIPAPPITNEFNLKVENLALDAGTYNCTGNSNIAATVRNTGSQPINGFTYSLAVNESQVSSTTYSSTLQPGETVNVPLGNVNFTASGNVEVFFKAQPIDVLNEFDVFDNSLVKRFNIRPQVNVPFFEGFESEMPTGPLWATFNPDADKTWDTLRTGGIQWSSFSAAIDFGRYSPRSNQVDGLISPAIQISLADSAALRFKYCYTFLHQSFADTLSIHISTDCGQTWSAPLFKKGGLELASHDTSGSNFLPVLPSNWKEVHLSLNSFLGNDVLIQFRTVNRKGNTLAVDNIRVYAGQEPISVSDQHGMEQMGIYPNPGLNQFELSGLQAQQSGVLSLIDLTGREVFAHTLITGPDGKLRVAVTDEIKAGAYMVRWAGKDLIQSVRWIKL